MNEKREKNLINILPKHYEMYDCYLNNIIGPVSDYWNVCHLPVLWAEFNFFNMNDNPHTFEDLSISVGSRFIRGEIWKDYCGISLKTYRCKDFNEFRETILEELDNKKPIGVTLDSNNVPWNTYFQIRPHCLLVCGINDNTGDLLCCDGDFHSEGICEIDIQYLFNQYHDILLLNNNKVESRKLNAALNYFIYVIKKNNPKKSENIKMFIDSFEKCWETSDISKIAANISKSYFLLDLTNVCNSRYNFMKGLQFFYQEFQTDLFFSIIHELNDLYNKWDAFKGLYIKAILSGKKRYIESAISLLCQVKEEEEDLTNKILLCCMERMGKLP